MSALHRPAPRAAGYRTAISALLGVVLLAWIVLPTVPVVLWSVAGQWRAPDILPTGFSADGIRALWSGEILAAGVASLALGGSVALTATPLGALAALALRRLQQKHARPIEVILLAPLAIPPFALVMGANVLLLGARVPTFPAVVLVLTVTALPYTFFMFRAALTGYDDRFEEVARTLGAPLRQVVTHVRVPLLSRATARAGFLAFLVGWSDYITTVLVGGGQVVTLPLLLGSAASATGNEQLTAALSLAMIGPPLLLLALLAGSGSRGSSHGSSRGRRTPS